MKTRAAELRELLRGDAAAILFTAFTSFTASQLLHSAVLVTGIHIPHTDYLLASPTIYPLFLSMVPVTGITAAWKLLEFKPREGVTVAVTGVGLFAAAAIHIQQPLFSQYRFLIESRYLLTSISATVLPTTVVGAAVFFRHQATSSRETVLENLPDTWTRKVIPWN